MSAEGIVPPARPRAAVTVALALGLALACGAESGHFYYPAVSRISPGGDAIAFARVQLPCDSGCWSLNLGRSHDEAEELQRLDAGQECTEIAWTKDGARVAFLIDGYQLRFFDAATRRPAGQVNIIDPQGSPPARIARGLTFSENGRAVTFDDCPRESSGCRPGLVAVPVMEGKSAP